MIKIAKIVIKSIIKHPKDFWILLKWIVIIPIFTIISGVYIYFNEKYNQGE